MIEREQRRMLGAFIRAHRERLRPDGPPGRRRTPGLRREELADRARISPTWCTWLEQGRAVQASPAALARLADALRLSSAERAYLFQLADRVDPAGVPKPTPDLPDALAAVVGLLAPPAYGLDRLWNAVCWNTAAADLFRGWLDGAEPRNLLHFVFLNPAARTLIPHWEDRARRLLAEFRADYSQTFRDDRVPRLVAGLREASADFTRLWDAQAVEQRLGGVRTFHHADRGELRFVQHTLTPAERPDYKVVLLVPA